MRLYKKILFLSFIFVLFIPLIQINIPFFKLKPLKGAYVLEEKPDSIEYKWFSEEYQQQYDKYFNDHLGFRNLLVRANNQIKFSFFDKIGPKNTVVGKQNVLYQYYYIDSYLGMDYVGEDIITREVDKVRFVQEELQKRNKKLLYVIAPGKASLYPEFFPLYYDTISKKVTNYDTYITQFKKEEIDYLDLSQFLLNIKDTCKYPLFPKNGTHWSGYSVALCADTLSKHIGFVTHKSLVRIDLQKGKVEEEKLYYTDNDIGDALNLLFDLSKWKMYYPNIRFYTKKKKQVNALIVGDSFAQSFYGFDRYFLNIFTQSSRYFYYYKTVFWPSVKDKSKRFKKNLEIEDILKDKELVIILSTEQNLKNHGFGLIDDLFQLFKREYKALQIKEQTKVIQRITSDKKWLKKIKKQAEERKISLDSMLVRNANYIINKRKSKLKP